MTRLGALTLVALALALAACGGDDDGGGSSTNSSPPSTGEEARTATEETDTTAETDGEEREPEDDGDEQGSERKAPSLAEYIQSADRICRRTRLAITRRSAEYRDVAQALSRGKIDRQEYFRRGGVLTQESGETAQRAVVDLKELPPPASRRDAVEAYLHGAAKQSAILTAQGRALRAGRNEEVAELNRRIAQVGQETREAARRVGFRICGGGSG